MSEACRALGVPVISGNVSFYNETEGRSIYPTPAVAMVGVIPDLAALPEPWFQREGDRIVLLGEDRSELGGAAYLRLLYGIEQGRPPAVDLEAELRLAELLRSGIARRWIRTAHDLSEGGLLIALAEACFGRRRLLGARVEVPLAGAALFSESQARAIVACPPTVTEALLREAEAAGVPARDIGEVGGTDLEVRTGGETLKASVAALHEIWSTELPVALGL
jgi:phosphoribosylformylglycinamidine synthase